MTVVVIILGAFLFSFLMTTVYRRFWSENLDVIVDFKEDAVMEGADSELTETISNRKWLFLPMLQVGFETHKNLQFGQEENVSVSDLCYKRDVFSVGGYQKITRTIPFHCSKRGFYEIESADLITRSPLLTEKFHTAAKQNTYIYGYPKLIENALLDISFQKIMGEITARKNIYEDPFEFRGIREYQPADPMSKINWKASAKSEEWMVNLYGSTNSQDITILLDLEDETAWKYDDIHEEQIRLAVTMAERFAETGIPVGLITNGKDIKLDKTLSLEAGTGKQQFLNINRGLARIDLAKNPESMEHLILKERENLSHLQKTYIMISKNQRVGCYDAFLDLIHQGTKGFWISTRYNDMEWKLPRYGNLPVIDWEVER